jgi:hypothetical protein
VDFTPIYHVAFVVESIEEATEAWGKALGIRFGRLQTPTILWGTPEGQREQLTKFVYSLNGPPYIELLERQDDSLWETVGFHHLGVWSEDVPGDSDRLVEAGCPWNCAILNPEGQKVGGCIHTVIDGARIELVSHAVALPRLARYIGGGDY